MKIKYIVLIIATLFLSCNNNKKATYATRLIVYAGAGLTDALTEICDSFLVSQKVEVKLSLASSGTLARQIVQGGSPDLFISASTRWANYIDSLGFVIGGLKTLVAGNDLSLIQPIQNKTELDIQSAINWDELLKDNYLSIGDPNHVPAGKYAVEALKYYGWYDKMQQRILPAKDVRSALMVVELGEVPFGIVYKTDALKSKKVKIVADLESKSHQPISNIASVISTHPHAEVFYHYLQCELAKTIWLKHGFKID